MSRRKEKLQRKEWGEWVASERRWIGSLALPDAVFATEGHWRYFLDYGTLPAVSRQPGFLLEHLGPYQLREILSFVEHHSRNVTPRPGVAAQLRQRLGPSWDWDDDYREPTVRDAAVNGADAMTERAWLTSSDADRMLTVLRGGVSDRKLRLFACACCRRLESAMTDARTRHALDMIERYTAGNGTRLEVEAAIDAAALAEVRASGSARLAARAVTAAWATPEHARSAAALATLRAHHESKDQAELLREIVGNPFRAPTVDPSWLAWNDGCIPQIARQIYDGGCFDNLPILADALEDAGCTTPVLLNHLRRRRGHMRGCWALDAILGAPIFEDPLHPSGRRWTIQRTAECEGKYIRQNCHGQFARLTLQVSPTGGKDPVALVNAVPADRNAQPWLVGIETGIREVLQREIAEGRRLRGIRVLLTQFTEHPADSSSHAFARAASAAFSVALDQGILVPV